MVVFWFNAASKPASNRINPAVPKVAVFGALAMLGGAVLTIRGEFGPMISNIIGIPVLSQFITGFMFGLVIAHFIVDAHAWRLRDAPQRVFFQSRFQSVFD